MMECAVCKNPRTSAVCPVCGFDAEGAESKDLRALEARRAAFRAGALTQAVHISRRDRARPWMALGLGFLLFVVWMKACSSAGWPLFH